MLGRSGRFMAVLHTLLEHLVLGALFAGLAAASVSGAERPKVRTITAFIRLDPAQYQRQVAEALTMLRSAKLSFESSGYVVESLRIATQPFPEYTRGMTKQAALAFFHNLDNLAKQDDLLISIGPAMLSDQHDPAQAQLLAEILSLTDNTYGSVVVAGTDGVHWRAVDAAAGVMKYLEDHTPGSMGNFRFAALANVVSYTPFFPAAYHQGAGHQFSVALESANVVFDVMAVRRDAYSTRQALIATLGMYARAVNAIANQIDFRTGWTYMGQDLSPAPMKEASIASATAGFTGQQFGTSGTLTAAATITSALHNIMVKQVGYSGLMMPVLEDTRLAELWGEGALSMDQLLAYSAVCGTGLDTIPLPGDVTTDQLERIIGDVATLSSRLAKPLSARLLPIAGLKPGDRTTFNDPHLVNTTIQPLP